MPCKDMGTLVPYYIVRILNFWRIKIKHKKIKDPKKFKFSKKVSKLIICLISKI